MNRTPKVIAINIQRGNEKRKEVETNIKELQKIEPYIGLNEIRRRIGGSDGIISNIIYKTRRHEQVK